MIYSLRQQSIQGDEKVDLEKKLEKIEGCLKKHPESQQDFETCIAPMTVEDTRAALKELDDSLKKD